MSTRIFTELLYLVPQIKPHVIIQMGDLYDMFSQGRWARTYDLMTPKQEITDGRLQAEDFWAQLKRLAPESECVQILGNHDDRPMKRILDKAPEIAALIDIKHLWNFNGVKTIHESRQEVFIDGVCFMHGFRSKLGDHARYNQCSTVVGHSHTGGVVYMKVRGDPKSDRFTETGSTIFELNAGYIGDGDSVPMQYTAQKLTRWTHGFGLIDELGPRFCPL